MAEISPRGARKRPYFMPARISPYPPVLDGTSKTFRLTLYQKGPLRVGMIPPGGRRKAASLRLDLYPAQREFGQLLDQLMRALLFKVTVGVLGLLDKVCNQIGDLKLP